jgi:transmembrane sensor
MNEMNEAERQLAPLEVEAQAWIRRLTSGEATAADARALQRWCRQSKAHASAFSEASQFWQAFGQAGRSLLEEEKIRVSIRSLPARRGAVGRRALLGGALAASVAGLLVTRPPGLESNVGS